MADKLSIYNLALLELKTTRIRSLTDARSERRALDSVWAATLDYMLEQGMWNFAARGEELQPSDTVESQFGYTYAYEKPDDYVRILKISASEDFVPTLGDFEDYNSYFLADVFPLYLLYVSKDTEYGADPGKWTPTFSKAFAFELASRAPGITSLKIEERNKLEVKTVRELSKAKGKDAVNQPASEIPPGRLTSSRRGFTSHTYNAQRKAGYRG